MSYRTTLDAHWTDPPDSVLELDAPLVYERPNGEIIAAPEGFRSDLASVPRLVPGIVRVFFRPALQTAWAAVTHDYLYREQDRPRSEADRVFWEALRDTGETRVGAWLMWSGVRIGGWVPWGRSTLG